jgi:DNA-binding response OmpR family regulator
MTAPATSNACDRKPNVLVADEDDATRAFLADNLVADRYSVRVADSREKALAMLSVEQPDLIVVDVNGKTLDLIDAIRNGDGLASRIDPGTPLIVLTSRSEELHRIRALERGGDDVLTKPFSYPELRARIVALLRRSQARRARRVLRAGALSIDLTKRTAQVGEQRLELPAKEYDLLRTLAADPTRVFTRQELFRSVWGQAYGNSRTLDSHACRLRRRLIDAGASSLLINVWGVGYRLIDPIQTP